MWAVEHGLVVRLPSYGRLFLCGAWLVSGLFIGHCLFAEALPELSLMA